MNDEPRDPELPRGIALAWGVAANPQRGPKRELSIERIVDAAIEIADAGGLGAVSMASVASSLGFTPMSLYRYVSAKDDLVLLMSDAAIGAPPETVRETEGWRERLRIWSRAQVAVYLEHPWLLDIPIGGGFPSTPNNVAWLDEGLAALADTPLDRVERLAVALLVLSQTRWQGIIERSYDETAKASGADPDEIDIAMEGMLRTLITPEAFPEVHAALLSGAFGPGGGDPFAFGLERVLDGIEHYLRDRPEGARTPPAEPPADPPEVARDPKVKEAVRARREAERQLRDARKRERERLREARDRLRR